MDGLSLVLVTLTAVCVPCALGYGLWAGRSNLRAYAALMLILESAVVLLGAFRDWWLIGALASLEILLAAMYMLRWISAVLHDAPADPSPGLTSMGDLRWEAAYLVPLIVAVLALSVYPYAVTHRVADSMHGIVSAVTAKGGP